MPLSKQELDHERTYDGLFDKGWSNSGRSSSSNGSSNNKNNNNKKKKGGKRGGDHSSDDDDARDEARDEQGRLRYKALYGIIGEKRISGIIEDFYNRVFGDAEDTHFRDAFRRANSLEHHVWAQTMFWLEAMGGGPHYHGGRGRLSFHHGREEARIVMNLKGALRWVYHMHAAWDRNLENNQVRSLLSKRRPPVTVQDVREAMTTFVSIGMKRYATEFNFPYKGPLEEAVQAMERPVGCVAECPAAKLSAGKLKRLAATLGADLPQGAVEKAQLVSLVVAAFTERAASMSVGELKQQLRRLGGTEPDGAIEKPQLRALVVAAFAANGEGDADAV